MADHMIQYAFVGDIFVGHTEGMTDGQVRDRAASLRLLAHVGGYALERYDRCPECEVWTRTRGELRAEIDCPAVQKLLTKEGGK